jgi:large conductance mechanosensitive channel
MLALRRWFREFTEFFFQKGNALNLAIAVVVGTQFQQIVDALTEDLLMPLLNPLIRNGGWEKWVIPYAGGELLIGQAINVLLNSLIVGWALFLIVKAINRSQRMASVGLDQVRGRQKAEAEV